MKKVYLIFLLVANVAKAQTPEPIGTARLKANGTTVTIAGIVTNSASFDNRNRNRCIQDATGGMNLFGAGIPELQALVEGDSVLVTGILSDFTNLKQISVPFTLTKIASGKVVPAPIVLSVADLENSAIAEQYESMLVQVNDIIIDTGDRIFGSGTSGRSYDIDDPANPVTGNCFPASTDCTNGPIVRISPGNSLVGTDVPKGTVSFIGNLAQFNAAYQITPRGSKDMILGLSISGVNQSKIQKNSFNLSFQTNQQAKARVRWGTVFLNSVNTSDTTNYIADYDTTFVGEMNSTNLTTSFSFDITGLNEASLYFVEIFCQNETGVKRIAFTDVYTTASSSTGDIKIFFNKSVDVSFSRGGAVANVTADMSQILANYIDKAQTSIDVAIYNMNIAGGAKIATALNAAQARGVSIRYLFGGESANTAISLLSSNFPKMRDRNSTGAAALQRTGTGNHNKFIVIDPNSVLNSFVLTGSGNFTDNNLFQDPNSFQIIQDQALARSYRAEFEEMWGEGPVNPNSTATVGTSPDFNRQSRSRLGAQKIKNTPSKFIIGERLVELYYSPTDGTTSAIRNALYSTDNDLRFGLLILTSDDLRLPIDSMQNVGWDVKGLIDDENALPDAPLPAGIPGSDYFWLRDRNVNVNSYVSATIQLHHKYAVVDAVKTNSDPLVVVGSFNWTSAAETTNDENLLIIHDAAIANMFRQEFGQRWFEATGVRDAYLLALDSPQNTYQDEARVYPNPSLGNFTIQFDRNASTSVATQILDLQGKVLQEQTWDGSSKIEIHTQLPKGMYILHISLEGKKFIRKIVVTN